VYAADWFYSSQDQKVHVYDTYTKQRDSVSLPNGKRPRGGMATLSDGSGLLVTNRSGEGTSLLRIPELTEKSVISQRSQSLSVSSDGLVAVPGNNTTFYH
jgi:hypothetical protein